MGMRAVIISAVIIAFCGYMCYERLPDGLSEPWKLRFQRLTYIAVILGCQVVNMFGGGDTFILMRHVFEKVLPSAQPLEDELLEIYDTSFDDVKVRVYRPKKANKQLPGLMYYHGGGWFFLSVDIYDGFTRRIAKDGNIVVVSVEYRLMPEHKYPIPFDDCVTATKYFMKNAEKFGVDPKRIGVAGDSAGGNLAAAVSLKLRDDRFVPQIRTQIVLYPVLQGCAYHLPIHDLLSGITLMSALLPSYKANYVATEKSENEAIGARAFIDPQLQQQCRKLVSDKYIPDELKPDDFAVRDVNSGNSPGARSLSKKMSDPYAFPLMATSLANLPPAYVFTVELDELRDEGIIYAKRLQADGVQVTWIHYKNTTHGVLSMDYLQVCADAYGDLMAYITRSL